MILTKTQWALPNYSDSKTQKVLMLGYMNAESLRKHKTLEK